MNKYIATLIFYIASFVIIYVLNWLSPGAHDGGLGFGSIALILLVFVIIALIGISIYKGIKKKQRLFYFNRHSFFDIDWLSKCVFYVVRNATSVENFNEQQQIVY